MILRLKIGNLILILLFVAEFNSGHTCYDYTSVKITDFIDYPKISPTAQVASRQ